MFHYTDDDGFKAIASQIEWRFKAFDPPGPHPRGAYFTTLPPDAPDLCAKLFIPKRKTEYLFEFSGGDDLKPLDGGRGRGRFVLYSPVDYVVAPPRQQYKSRSADYNKADQEQT